MFPNPSRQHSKQQTRGEEIEKCLDEGLEPTYYFSILSEKLHQSVSNLNSGEQLFIVHPSVFKKLIKKN